MFQKKKYFYWLNVRINCLGNLGHWKFRRIESCSKPPLYKISVQK